MAAIYEVEVKGFDQLQKAISAIEELDKKQLNAQKTANKLSKENNDLLRSIRNLVADGYNVLTQALTKVASKEEALAKQQTKTAAANKAAITSVKALAAAWNDAEKSATEIIVQLEKQVAASRGAATALGMLTKSTHAQAVAARELFIADQANIAAVSRMSAGYSQIATLMGQRRNLETGVANVITTRTAKEQALLAIERQKSAVDGIIIRNLQTRMIAESGLSNAQKIRAMVELGLIRASDAYGASTARNVVQTRNLTAAQTALGSAMRGVGAAAGGLFLTYGKMVPMIASFVAAIGVIKTLKMGTEFDYVTRYATEVAKSSGDASVSLERLQDTLLGFTGLSRGPLEIADGYRELVKAGYSAEESLKQVEYATKFAVVSEMELADATQSLVGLTRAFAEEGQDMAKVADIVAKAALLSSTDVKEMTDAMAHMTELASVADVSLTEVATAMGLMANAGIRGSKAATSVRTAVLRILAPTESLQHAMDAAGVSIDAISDDGKIKGMKELFSSVQKIVNVLPKREQTAFLADMFDIRTLKGAATLLESIKSGSWDDFYSQLEKAKGYVGDLHKELEKSSRFWADELSASFERAAIAAGDADSVTEALKKMNDIVSDPAFSAGLGFLATAVMNVGNSLLNLVSGPVGAISLFVEQLRSFKAEIAAFYDLPDLKLPNFTDGNPQTLGGAMATLNPYGKMKYVAGLIGGGLENISGAIVGYRKKSFLESLPTGGGAVPLTSAEYKVPEYIKGFTSGNLYSSSTGVKNNANEALSYGMVSMDPTIAKISEGISKFKESAEDDLARFGTSEERKIAAIKKAKAEADELKASIDASEAYGAPELGTKRATELQQIDDALAVKLKAIDKEYDKREQKEGERQETLKEKMAKIQNIQQQYMPEGQAKDIAELNKKYQDGVAAIQPYIKAQGQVGEEARKTKAILDQSLKSGTLEIQAKYVAEYADKIEDAENALAGLSAKDKSLGTLASETDKISVGFDKFRNTQKAVADGFRKDLSPGSQEAAKSIDAIVQKSYEAEDAMKAAFKTELLDEFNKALADVNEEFEMISPYDARLKDIQDRFKNLRDLADERFKGTKEHAAAVAEVDASLQKALANDIALNKASNNLWNGFKAGAIEAQKELRTLGDLGYDIFQDLKEGLSGVFKAVLTGDFDSVGEKFKEIGSSILDSVTTHIADNMATNVLSAGSNLFGGLFDSIGLGGIFGGQKYTNGAANVYVTNMGGLDALLGTDTSGGILGGLGGKVSGLLGGITSGGPMSSMANMALAATAAVKAVTSGIGTAGTWFAGMQSAGMGVNAGTQLALIEGSFAKAVTPAVAKGVSAGMAGTTGTTSAAASGGAAAGGTMAALGTFATAVGALGAVILGIKALMPGSPTTMERLRSSGATDKTFDATGLTTEIQHVSKAMHEMAPALGRVSAAAWDTTKNTLTAVEGMSMEDSMRQDYANALVKFTYTFDQATGSWTRGTSIMTKQEAENNKVAASASKAAAGAAQASTGLDSLSSAGRSVAGSVAPVPGALKSVGDAARGVPPSIYSLSQSMVGLGGAASATANAMAGSVGAIRSAAGSIQAILARSSAQNPSYKKHGGRIGYASGGVLQGGSYNKDDLYLGTVNGVAQIAMGGEYIMPQKQTRKYLPLLEGMRRQEYAAGGQLPKSALDALAAYASAGSEGPASIVADIMAKLAEFEMTDYQKSLFRVYKEYEDTKKQLIEAGGTKAHRQLLDKLRDMQVEQAELAPIKEATTALSDFKKELMNVKDATYSTTQAQASLSDLLAKAKTGDFSGVDNISDLLGHIKLEKSNYATSLDYARAYWSTMSMVTELEKLTGVKAKVPGFASGGIHYGGLRVVGESGPELEYTGPSRIFNAQQLIDLSALIEELRAMRRDITSGNVAVATNTKKTADALRRFEIDGMPVKDAV